MGLLKKLLLAISIAAVSISAISVTPAIAAGKIEKATAEEVTITIAKTIELSEKTLAAVIAGEMSKDEILALMKETKQSSKLIESNIVDRLRSKASERLAKGRSAFKKGKKDEAVELLTKVVEIFKEVQIKHAAF